MTRSVGTVPEASGPALVAAKPFARRLMLASLVASLGFGGAALSATAATAQAGANRVTAHVPAIGQCQPTPENTAQTSKSVKFPFAAYEIGSGSIKQSSPAVATVTDASGNPETVVVFGDEEGYVHVVDASTCKELPGWPSRMQAPTGDHASIESSPAIGYLDGPNKPPSIIVGSGSTWTGTDVGEIEAFNWNGNKRFVMTVRKTPTNNVGVFSSPAVGDVAGGSLPDIVFGGWNYYLYVLNGHGKILARFYNAETIWSSPALYRLPGRVTDDIYIGNDRTQPGQCVGGYMSDFFYKKVGGGPYPGELAQRWTHCQSVWRADGQGQSVWSSPAVGVPAPGEDPDVFVGTSWYETPFGPDTNDIFAYNAKTGVPVNGWPVHTDGPVFGSPALADVDGSGNLDVIDTSFVCTKPIAADSERNCFTGRSEVDAFTATGTLLWKDLLLGPTDLSSPIAVPLENHSDPKQNDVLVGSGDGLFPIGPNGTFMFGTSDSSPAQAINPGCQMFNTPAAADVAGSGPFNGWYVFASCDGPAGNGLYAYPLPYQPTGAAAWPMFHQNADHTGAAGLPLASTGPA